MPQLRASPSIASTNDCAIPCRLTSGSTTRFSISHSSGPQRAITNPVIACGRCSAMKAIRLGASSANNASYSRVLQCAAVSDCAASAMICGISAGTAARIGIANASAQRVRHQSDGCSWHRGLRDRQVPPQGVSSNRTALCRPREAARPRARLPRQLAVVR